LYYSKSKTTTNRASLQQQFKTQFFLGKKQRLNLICYICLADSEEQKEQLYWLCYGLWHSKAFHYYLKGSVIPYISIDELNQCLSKSFLKSNENKQEFEKAIQLFKHLEKLEIQFEKNLQLIKDTRRAIFYKRSFFYKRT
jgi:hypothetical protein